MTPANCANCETPIVANAKFCIQCGQTTHLHRINFAHLLHELVHFFTHADKGIFLLIRYMATQPGTVIREYLAGKRKKYFSPLNFFLLAVGLFVFTQTTLKPLSRALDLTELREQVRKHPDPVVRERRLKKIDRQEFAQNFVAKNSNYINFALVPVIAFVFFLFYRKAGYNYTEHLVAHLYLSGFSALVFVFFITPYLLATGETRFYLAGVFTYMLFEIFYRTIAYYRFIGRKGTRTFLYALLASVTVILLWFIFSSFMMAMYINNGFGMDAKV